jgi:WD40 repeat protein
VTCVTFIHKSGMLASGGWDETIRLWDPKYGRDQGQLAEESEDLRLIATVAAAPSGDMLAAGDGSGQIVLWNLPGRTTIGRLSEHEGRVRQVAFSPDGRWIASADDRGDICLWRAGQPSPS